MRPPDLHTTGSPHPTSPAWPHLLALWGTLPRSTPSTTLPSHGVFPPHRLTAPTTPVLIPGDWPGDNLKRGTHEEGPPQPCPATPSPGFKRLEAGSHSIRTTSPQTQASNLTNTDSQIPKFTPHLFFYREKNKAPPSPRMQPFPTSQSFCTL